MSDEVVDGGGGYLPALRFDALLRFYDPLQRRAMRDVEWKRAFVDEVGVDPDHRVLDVGCGTGTLVAAIEEACPGADVAGLDPDAAALDLAGDKVDDASASAGLLRGLGGAIPFPEAAFDRAFTTLVFHHLPDEEKAAVLEEMHRVLEPGGVLGLADIGAPSGPLMRLASLGPYLFDGPSRTRSNLAGALPRFLAEAGFEDVEETGATDTLFGTVRRYRARRP